MTKQREIKFRAWDKSEKFMYNTINDFTPAWISVAVMNEDGGHLEQRKIEDVILMQYTGLKDKNGKEIYEGDIVKWIANDGEDIYPHESEMFEEVEFLHGSYQMLCEMPESEFEVVGNIYENKDLLK